MGLAAQKEYIDYFVKSEKGTLIADFEEVYTGKDLAGCTELRKAMQKAKEEDAILIIAKTDRFRNTMEALKIYEEMGDGRIFFCDLPHTDKFTLTLFFALAEREAMLVSIRTKAALAEKKKQGFKLGNPVGDTTKAGIASAKAKHEKAQRDKNNKILWGILQNCKTAEDYAEAAALLGRMGVRTATGLPITPARAKDVRKTLKKVFSPLVLADGSVLTPPED